eukprot:3431130-Rhodomonas_salina.1
MPPWGRGLRARRLRPRLSDSESRVGLTFNHAKAASSAPQLLTAESSLALTLRLAHAEGAEE